MRGIKGFHLGLGQVAFVEIDGRVFNNIFLAAAAHGRNFGTENDGDQEIKKFLYSFTFINRHLRNVAVSYQFGETGFRHFGEKLVLGIMVMDAIAEKHSFGIDRKLLEIIPFPIALIGIENGFQGLADAKVVLVVLVEKNIAPTFGSFT